MAGGLAGLLHDVAVFARMAAASLDDVGAAAERATAKAAGVVIDDAAVTPAQVRGLAVARELPIIARIARGSLQNKLLLILPAALLLSELLPSLVELLLMAGGAYLAYEGAHKILHRPGGEAGGGEGGSPGRLVPEAEVVSGAVRTDFVLSAEIMVIALKEVIGLGFVHRAAVLVVVALSITAAVYGVVALIVKMDDVGLYLAGSSRRIVAGFGRFLVGASLKVLVVLSVVGTAAMTWVGGHILIAGAGQLGWAAPDRWVHGLVEQALQLPGPGPLVAWVAETGVSALVGFAVGAGLVLVSERMSGRWGRGGGHGEVGA